MSFSFLRHTPPLLTDGGLQGLCCKGDMGLWQDMTVAGLLGLEFPLLGVPSHSRQVQISILTVTAWDWTA